ncbi:hypothetical protein BDZ45DRAFT_735127 [Acephala macrosclerotiorum]|nr:hypothetical protein BDZ45DRAFT_735127 [Acephala macrosclerotiorum]
MATFVFDPACGGHRGEHRLVENRRSSARTTPARSICFVPIYQELYHCRLSGVCATYYLGAKRSTLGRKRNALVDYVRRRSDVANAPEWLAFSRWDKGLPESHPQQPKTVKMSTALRSLHDLTRRKKILYLGLAAYGVYTITGGYVLHVGSDPWSYHSLRLCVEEISWVDTLSIYLSGNTLRFKRWWIKYWYGKTEWELFIEMLEQNRRQVLEGSELGHPDIENCDPRDPEYYNLIYGFEDADID